MVGRQALGAMAGNAMHTRAIGLGQETAEKQAPSALDFVGIFNQAIQATMKENPRVSQLIALNTCIADYNKDVKIKRWRVDTLKRKIIGNMLKVPEETIRILAEHYDLHRHGSSGPDALLWSLQSNALEGLGEEESEDDSGSASSSKSDLQRRAGLVPSWLTPIIELALNLHGKATDHAQLWQKNTSVQLFMQQKMYYSISESMPTGRLALR
ncbi:unnamed protein product [Durusdinium trenchii]|uniref:Uncharacterized protein n=1 Tax=Durusdinium trenchii TaxID=1381693 RepID=A0ABP0NUZ8_9DINO